MKILAFETASPSGGVALLVDNAVVGEMRLNNAQAHSRHCLKFAETLLETSRIKWEEIDLLATSHGPGAFTGVRVGLTLVKGLAWSLGKPCVTVSSLEALARHAWCGETVDHVVPLLDARAGEIYGAVFRIDNGLVREREDFAGTAEEALAGLSGTALFAGEGARKYFDGCLSKHGVLARADRLLPSAAAVALLAAESFRAGHQQSAEEIAAVYLREATTAPPLK